MTPSRTTPVRPSGLVAVVAPAPAPRPVLHIRGLAKSPRTMVPHARGARRKPDRNGPNPHPSIK